MRNFSSPVEKVIKTIPKNRFFYKLRKCTYILDVEQFKRCANRKSEGKKINLPYANQPQG